MCADMPWSPCSPAGTQHLDRLNRNAAKALVVVSFVQAAVCAGLQVGDQSDFVNVFSKVLGQLGPRIGASLSGNYFRFFCDKLANSFTPRFYEYIFR